MSGKFRFISLTDSSLLIADSSDTGIEIDEAFGLNLSFLDVRITHEQLLRFFLLSDNARVFDFFSRIVYYRRKFFEEIPTEDVVKLAVALATEFEELFLEDTDFEYFHLRRRLPQDNILFSESISTPRIVREDELLFLSEKVARRLPDLIAKHATADEKTAFEYIVEFFDERLDLLHIQNTRPEDTLELLEVLNAYKFVGPKEPVYTKEKATKLRGLQAPHETQILDPFGDGSVPQKPGFDHIVELLDERVDLIRIRGAIQQATGTKEVFLITKVIENPNDKIFSVVQELLKLHKKINLDPTALSLDIAYLQTGRNTSPNITNFIDFDFFKNIEDSTKLLDNRLVLGLAENLRDRVYQKDDSLNTIGKAAKHATNTSGKPDFDFIVEIDSLPKKKVDIPFEDDSTLQDVLLQASSSILRDRIYQKDTSSNLVRKPAKHFTNTSGKPDFDYIVEVNAQRDSTNSLTNFVDLTPNKINSENLLAKEAFLGAAKAALFKNNAYTSPKLAKTIKNYFTTIQNTLEGTVEGYEGNTQTNVGATVRRNPTTPRPEGGFVDLGPNKVKSENLLAAQSILHKGLVAGSGNGLLNKVFFNQNLKFNKFIDKTVPVYFATTFSRTGSNAHSPGSPKIRWLNSPTYELVDPYYIERQQKLGLTWADTGVESHWLDATNTFTVADHDPRIQYQSDSESREDFALVDDGHGKLAGDFTNLEGADYKIRVPEWGGQATGWRLTPGPVYYDTLDSSGKRILYKRDYQQLINSSGFSEAELGRSPNYVIVNGARVQQGYLQQPIRATGKTILEKLEALGILGGTFSFKETPRNPYDFSRAIDVVANFARSKPLEIDRVSAFFYPNGQHPEGEPEDVELKRTLGRRKEFIYVGYQGPIYDTQGNLLAVYDLQKVSKDFKNSHKKILTSLGKTFEGIIGAAESEYEGKSRFHHIHGASRQLPLDRSFLRSRRYRADGGTSDVKVSGNKNNKEVIYIGRVGPIYDDQGNVIANYNLQKIVKAFKNSHKKTILYTNKLVEAIQGIPNENISQADTIVAASLAKINTSRAFVKQEKFAIKEFLEIDEGDPSLLDIIPKFLNNARINLATEQPSGNDIVRRWGNDIYISYTQENFKRSDQGGYSYTGFNTYTANNPLEDWQRPGYGPTISVAPYDGTYNYSKGIAWNGDFSFNTFDNTPYYYNSTRNAAFLFSTVSQEWVFVTDFNGNNEEANPVNSSNTKRPFGSFSVVDPVYGGILNLNIVYNNYVRTFGPFFETFWFNTGNIENIYGGEVQYPYTANNGDTVYPSHTGRKLYMATDGHLYMPLYRVIGTGVASGGSLSTQLYGTPPGGIWKKVSDKTFLDLRPNVGEILAPVGVQAKNTATDKTFYQRKVGYNRTHTETVEAADPGSAFIPVYCASYFLEPYVSEVGKFANF